MNFVAAMLLLVMKKEEDAFWMLAVLVENVLFDDCYSENLYGCHVEQRVFKDLLRKKLPRSQFAPSSFAFATCVVICSGCPDYIDL